MDRRGFLRLLGLAPVALVARKLPVATLGTTFQFTRVQKLAAPMLMGELGRWEGVRWVETIPMLAVGSGRGDFSDGQPCSAAKCPPVLHSRTQ